ncbi:MAG: HD domain-containing protein [Erysipelotrichaceae bacterium]|nr:HD domain-containing protein [Erysipelotrichaceae bacterium]
MKLFEKLDEIKVLRDPIHGYIHIEYKVIWDVINSKEFQRLRRIKQLGSSFVVYHTAEHSRFTHSLGVYEIVRRMCNEVSDISNTLSAEEKLTVMLAGLLHDVGHGPFSHTFESICDINHEVFSCRIIEENTTDLNNVLESYKAGLSKNISSIINHTHKNTILSQMISGQLDADRMDYLLRDAYFTGTKYGEFDLERILRTLRVKNNILMVKSSGVHSIEDYIMARYHMYWQVYYHPVARSFECVVSALFDRMREIYKIDKKSLNCVDFFVEFLKGESISLNAHFLLDENTCYYGFQVLSNHEDKILKDLARRIINRDLFEYVDYTNKSMVDDIKRKIKSLGFDDKYYVKNDMVKQRPYKPFIGDERSIWLLMDNGDVEELSKGSNIVNSISKGKNINDNKVFFPKGLIKAL